MSCANHNHLIDDSDDDDCEAYQMETYTTPDTGMLQSSEKLDLDARMNALPPEQVGIGREIYERNRTQQAQSAPPPNMTIRDTGNGVSSSNTGPKGVLADFEEAKKNLRSQRMMERLRREKAIQGKIRVEQFVQLEDEMKNEEAVQQKQEQQQKKQRQKVTKQNTKQKTHIHIYTYTNDLMSNQHHNQAYVIFILICAFEVIDVVVVFTVFVVVIITCVVFS